MITISMLAACAALTGANEPQAVNIGRVFTKGEKLTYQVRSHLQAQSRSGGLRTPIPEDLDINYDFTMEVQQLKADGIAVLHYKRPTMTIIAGETFDAPPKKSTEKSNFDLQLTLSPLNEIIDFKDLSKPAPKPPAKNKAVGSFGTAQDPLGSIIGQFVSEMYRLSLFAGSFDSALDLAPKMRGTTAKVGETWHKTVGYQPQKLRGKDGKSVVQRLDYEYTYKGRVTVNGKPFERIEANLAVNTDLGEFINDTFEVTSADTGIKKIPLTFKAKIEFDLDPVTRHTVAANANSEGSYRIFIDGVEEVAAYETTMKGRTTLRLASRVLPKK